MAMRHDAGSAAIRFAARTIEAFARRAHQDTVWNIGRCVFEPGGGNVVPRRAELLVEFRDMSDDLLDEFAVITNQLAREEAESHHAGVEIHGVTHLTGTEMDTRILEALQRAADNVGTPTMRLPSGAGHDAMVVAAQVPAGMVFVPSIDGRSHDPAEDTSEQDIVAGAQVLARAVECLIQAPA